MTYSTGSATNIDDLFDKISTFLVTAGWTENNRASGILSISDGAMYNNLFEDGSNITMSPATSYDGGAAWDSQPGQHSDYKCKIDGFAGSIATYHFFTNGTGDYFYGVIEIDPGFYRHIIFGTMCKLGSYTGGQICCAQYLNYTGSTRNFKTYDSTKTSSAPFGSQVKSDNDPTNSFCSMVRADSLDSNTDNWHMLALEGNLPTTGSRAFSTAFDFNDPEDISDRTINWGYKDWFRSSPNSYNSLTAFAPIHIYIKRPSDFYSPMGFMEDIRAVTITNFTPGEILTIGSDDWYIFPISAKGLTAIDFSGVAGYAVRKIP